LLQGFKLDLVLGHLLVDDECVHAAVRTRSFECRLPVLKGDPSRISEFHLFRKMRARSVRARCCNHPGRTDGTNHKAPEYRLAARSTGSFDRGHTIRKSDSLWIHDYHLFLLFVDAVPPKHRCKGPPARCCSRGTRAFGFKRSRTGGGCRSDNGRPKVEPTVVAELCALGNFCATTWTERQTASMF